MISSFELDDGLPADFMRHRQQAGYENGAVVL